MISPLFEMEGDVARGLLYGLLESNKLQLAKYPGMPSMRRLIRDGKVRYERSDPDEHWQTYKEIVDQVRQNGVAKADCEDLATAIAAEDQFYSGVMSLPYAYNPRPGLFHVVTAVPRDGYGAVDPSGPWPDAVGAEPVPGYVLQDPSVMAGMGSSFGYDDRRSAVYGAQGRGLGGILGSFRHGLLGDVNAADAARQVGAGARKGAGITGTFFEELGERAVGGAVPGDEGLEEDDIGGGSDEVSDVDGDEEFGFFYGAGDEDDEDDDVFGVFDDPEGVVGSSAWALEGIGDRVADDVTEDFGAVHGTSGVFREFLDAPDVDLHEQVGPHRAAIVGPRATFGSIQPTIGRTDLFGAVEEDEDEDEDDDLDLLEDEDDEDDEDDLL